jgi:surface antigen
MNKGLTVALVCCLSASLFGCSDMSKQDVGVLAGGAAGGLLGSQFGGGGGQVAATLAGAVAGAFIGGAIGNSMDKVDRMEVQKSLETQKTGQTTRWKNPDNGNSYAMTPTKTYQKQGRVCREYVTRAWIAGKEQQMHGRACRQPDGSWRVVS